MQHPLEPTSQHPMSPRDSQGQNTPEVMRHAPDCSPRTPKAWNCHIHLRQIYHNSISGLVFRGYGDTKSQNITNNHHVRLQASHKTICLASNCKPQQQTHDHYR